MTEEKVLEVLAKTGAIITDSHIVYTSWRHGTAYVNKDAVYPHTEDISKLCRAIAEHFSDREVNGIDVVVAPAVGGVILSQWTAHWLTELTGIETLAIYAEKSEDGKSFVFKRGYDRYLRKAPDSDLPKLVLVVEDVLTTGGSARGVVEAVRALQGEVVGVGVLCNRGGVTPEALGDVPELFALSNIKMDSWEEAECPLCAKGVPINTTVGKGREFLARQGK